MAHEMSEIDTMKLVRKATTGIFIPVCSQKLELSYI